MKKILLLALFVAGYQSFAQKGIYIKPTIAGGISNTAWSPRLYSDNGFIASYQVGVGVGYQLNHIRVESGLQYFRAGAKLNGLILERDYQQGIFAGDVFESKSYTNISERENYLAIPLKVGYEMALGSKWNLVPIVGVDIAYALLSGYDAIQYNLQHQEISSYKEHYNNNGKVRMLGTVSIQAEYRLNRKLAITAAPVAKYFFSDLGTLGNYRPQVLLLEAGVLYRF